MGLGDLEFFHATNNEPFVRRYLWDDAAVPREVSASIVEGVAAAFAEDGWGLWKIITRDAGAAIGYVGLWTFFDEPQPQLLYALREDCTGRGYATEASAQVLDHAFNTLSFAYLDASMDVANASSARVCERLGFGFLGERDIDGKPTRFYRMHSNEWGGARANRR